MIKWIEIYINYNKRINNSKWEKNRFIDYNVLWYIDSGSS